jgi:hypothetical protein
MYKGIVVQRNGSITDDTPSLSVQFTSFSVYAKCPFCSSDVLTSLEYKAGMEARMCFEFSHWLADINIHQLMLKLKTHSGFHSDMSKSTNKVVVSLQTKA